jgi:hypothetical protein
VFGEIEDQVCGGYLNGFHAREKEPKDFVLYKVVLSLVNARLDQDRQQVGAVLVVAVVLAGLTLIDDLLQEGAEPLHVAFVAPVIGLNSVRCQFGKQNVNQQLGPVDRPLD